MNTHDDDPIYELRMAVDAQKPCTRGCTYKPAIEGEEPKPRPAKHGHYCNRCYHRTREALSQTGSLVEHILSLVGSKGGGDDESQRLKGDPPLPFNVDAFNDANETYSRLVYWARVLAEILGVPAPSPAKRSWSDFNGVIRGLPNGATPGAAKLQVQAMSMWLEDRLDDICSIGGDDIDFFHDEWEDVARLAAKWPVRQRPRRSDVPCPVDKCGKQISVFPPEEVGDDEVIVCDTGHRIPPDKYEFYVRYYKEAQAERKSAASVQKHLMAKYAG